MFARRGKGGEFVYAFFRGIFLRYFWKDRLKEALECGRVRIRACPYDNISHAGGRCDEWALLRREFKGPNKKRCDDFLPSLLTSSLPHHDHKRTTS